MRLKVASVHFGLHEHVAFDWELQTLLRVVPHEHLPVCRNRDKEVGHAVVCVLYFEPLKFVDGFPVEVLVGLRLLDNGGLRVLICIPNKDLAFIFMLPPFPCKAVAIISFPLPSN